MGSGVKQGCILSPTLFALCIDDLVERLKEKEVGVKFGDCMVSALLYADDIVLTAPDVNELQESIKVVEEWCKEWRMTLNIGKNMHFRRKNNRKSDFQFTFREEITE